MDSSDLISQLWSEKRDPVWNSLLQSTRSQNALRSKFRTSDIKYATFFIFEKNSPLFAFFGFFLDDASAFDPMQPAIREFQTIFCKKENQKHLKQLLFISLFDKAAMDCRQRRCASHLCTKEEIWHEFIERHLLH